ncbi:ulp1 protease family, C-terminal catalytic domain-containing protein [Tanacetum coccineum]
MIMRLPGIILRVCMCGKWDAQMMDRNTWMYMVERFTADYMKWLSEFMKCVEDNRERVRETKIPYPCKESRNIVSLADPNMIRRHLIEHDFDKNYTCWDLHGETQEPQVDSQTFVSDTNHEENDRMTIMIAII